MHFFLLLFIFVLPSDSLCPPIHGQTVTAASEELYIIKPTQTHLLSAGLTYHSLNNESTERHKSTVLHFLRKVISGAEFIATMSGCVGRSQGTVLARVFFRYSGP